MRSQALRTHTLNMGLHLLKPRPQTKKATPSSSKLEGLQNVLNEVCAMRMQLEAKERKLEVAIQTERMRLLRHILGESEPEKEKTG
jgi:hypothetical protein